MPNSRQTAKIAKGQFPSGIWGQGRSMSFLNLFEARFRLSGFCSHSFPGDFASFLMEKPWDSIRHNLEEYGDYMRYSIYQNPWGSWQILKSPGSLHWSIRPPPQAGPPDHPRCDLGGTSSPSVDTSEDDPWIEPGLSCRICGSRSIAVDRCPGESLFIPQLEYVLVGKWVRSSVISWQETPQSNWSTDRNHQCRWILK